MIVVVLFTLLLLAGILAATLQLSLGSRQNTADQAATLKAQYAAESGLALARSHLRQMQNILSVAQTGSATGLKLSRSTSPIAIRTWVNQLCGSSTWQAITEGEDGGAGFYDKGADKSYPSAQACVPSGLSTDDNFILLARAVQPASYNVLPQRERPATDDASLKAFWRTVFTSPKVMSSSGLDTEVSMQLSISRILRLSSTYYRVYIKVPQVVISAAPTGARRVLRAQSAQTGEWWFDITQPSLLDAVVQDDYHTSEEGNAINYTTDTRFQGPVKTNDVFTFTTSSGNNSPSFSGQISSAGCIDRIQNADEITCTRQPGVRVDSTVSRTSTGTDAQRSTAIQSYIANQGVNVNYNGTTPNYASAYQPFPTAAQIQQNAAQGLDEDGTAFTDGSRGLTLATNEVGLEMFVGDANMNMPTSYNATSRTWQEAATSYQYFRPVTATNCTEQLDGTCNPTYSSTIYRVDRDMNLSSKTGTGGWIPMTGKFNGVVFKTGGATDTGLSVFGPTRLTASAATADTPIARARPAVASFMGLTLATARPIDIRTDLAMAQPPCRYDEYETVQLVPACKDRKNVLGLFSSAAKIVVKKQVPDNAILQVAMMSSQKEFTVEGYDSGRSRGDITFTGSLVEKYYGANGVFGTRCVARNWWGICTRTEQYSAGYGRDYSHDKRFLDGLAPPFYPVSPKWDFTDASRDGNTLTDLIVRQGT